MYYDDDQNPVSVMLSCAHHDACRWQVGRCGAVSDDTFEGMADSLGCDECEHYDEWPEVGKMKGLCRRFARRLTDAGIALEYGDVRGLAEIGVRL